MTTVSPERNQDLIDERAVRDLRRSIVDMTEASQRLALRVGSAEDRVTQIEQGLAQAAGHLRAAADLMEALLDSGCVQEAGESARNTE